MFHRVDDMTLLPGRVFCKLAARLTAYRGVLRERLLAETEGAPQPAPASGPAPQAAPSGAGREVIPATKAAIQAHGVLGGLISFG